MKFSLAVVSCRDKTQSVRNVRNGSSIKRVAAVRRPHGEPRRVDVKLVLTHFDFHLNAFFITLCPKCDISM